MPIAIVTGAGSGLGALIRKELAKTHSVIGIDLRAGVEVEAQVDVTDFYELEEFAARYEKTFGGFDILVNCAGVSHIDFLESMPVGAWDHVMDVNAKAIFLTAKACVPYMAGGTIVNIISNASHVPMTASLAYNASKGAAAIMTAQMARELYATHGITVFGISPNRLAGTPMSAAVDARVAKVRGWTPAQVAAKQAAAMPCGVETDPAVLAEFIGYLLSTKDRHRYLHGCDIPYGL